MYLSRVEIDNINRQKMKELTHAGAYHNWIEQCFPDEIFKKIRSRKLWRIDYLNGKPHLIVQSESKPNLSNLEKYGVQGTAETKDYEPFINKLSLDTEYLFRISVNPVISVKVPYESRGQVKQIIGTNYLMEFINKRSEKNGFSLNMDSVSIVNIERITIRKKNLNPETFSKVDYEGILKITDLEKFKTLLVNGLGKKKAYGCGLLTVIPIGE